MLIFMGNNILCSQGGANYGNPLAVPKGIGFGATFNMSPNLTAGTIIAVSIVSAEIIVINSAEEIISIVDRLITHGRLTFGPRSPTSGCYPAIDGIRSDLKVMENLPCFQINKIYLTKIVFIAGRYPLGKIISDIIADSDKLEVENCWFRLAH